MKSAMAGSVLERNFERWLIGRSMTRNENYIRAMPVRRAGFHMAQDFFHLDFIVLSERTTWGVQLTTLGGVSVRKRKLLDVPVWPPCWRLSVVTHGFTEGKDWWSVNDMVRSVDPEVRLWEKPKMVFFDKDAIMKHKLSGKKADG